MTTPGNKGEAVVPIDWLALWILLSAWCSLSGWGLSLLGELNSIGVGISFFLFVGCLIILRRPLQLLGHETGQVRFRFPIFQSRFLLPKIWLCLALLALIGGITHSPSNYDYLTYRFPRVLHWCWEQKWTWIPTINQRMNYSAAGFEWLMVPLFVVFKTDRLFFLINFISYLFLPGLVFSVFTGLGISKRISWWWMWILPCGYCYILQAASAANDSFATIYLLAALHYLFREKAGSPVRNLILSALAIALLTGAKASNLPLVLPWLIILFFKRERFLEKGRLALPALILIGASSVSFLPMALLNIHYAGDYSGDPANSGNLRVNNPVSAVIGNSLQLAVANLSPPLWPKPISWEPLVPSRLSEALRRDFPRLTISSGEMQIEEEAGLGLGLILFITVTIALGLKARTTEPCQLTIGSSRQSRWIAAAAWAAFFVYLAKMGSESTARLVAAYYPLLIAAILAMLALDERVVRRSIFKYVGLLAMLSAFPLVILSPARPLFPVRTVAAIMAKSHVPAGIIGRYQRVYGVYASRSDAFWELRALIPSREQDLGFLQRGNDPEAALWRPYGSREIIEVTPDTSLDELSARHIHYLVVSNDALEHLYNIKLDDLTAKWSATVVAKKELILSAQKGPESWYIIAL